MNIYSFDISPLKIKDKLYNIFQKNIQYSTEIQLFTYLVPREYEMRLDLISKRIYGSSNYVEELMVINNIINPYSVKENQEIYYCDRNSLNALYVKDDLEDTDDIREKIIKASQSNNKSSNNKNNETQNKIPTTLKPKNIKQVTIDTKNRKIRIMNSFK